MKISDMWSKAQSGQNVMVRTANLQVMSKFGSDAPPSSRARSKSKKDTKFVVGETKLGGEETV